MHKTRKRNLNWKGRRRTTSQTRSDKDQNKWIKLIYVHNICTVYIYKWIIHMQWTGPMCHGICPRNHPFPNSRAPHSSTKPETQQPQAPLINLRLFQHTFGTHPEQPLPTGHKGVLFIVGERGIAWGVRYRGVLYLSWNQVNTNLLEESAAFPVDHLLAVWLHVVYYATSLFSVTVQTISPYKMRSQTDINSKFHQVLSYNVHYLWLSRILYSLMMTSWRWWLTQTLVEILNCCQEAQAICPFHLALGPHPAESKAELRSTVGIRRIFVRPDAGCQNHHSSLAKAKFLRHLKATNWQTGWCWMQTNYWTIIKDVIWIFDCWMIRSFSYELTNVGGLMLDDNIASSNYDSYQPSCRSKLFHQSTPPSIHHYLSILLCQVRE